MEQKKAKEHKKGKRAVARYRKFGDTDHNVKLANALNTAADIEYNDQRFFGWKAFYMIDRLQASITGRAITNNTQKKLDASELLATTPKPK